MSDAVQTWARLDKPTAYELVVDRLRRAIHLAVYLPGDRLPAERVVAEQLGVSRTTVREALRFLEGEGYLRIKPGATGGSVVVAVAGSPEVRRERLRQRWPEFEAILDFREATEGAAAKFAAERRNEKDLASIEATIEALAGTADVAGFRREDSAFHLAVATASKNDMLRAAIEDARVAMFWPLDALEFDVILATSLEAHRKIARAITRQNRSEAQRAMAAHIERTRHELRNALGLTPSA